MPSYCVSVTRDVSVWLLQLRSKALSSTILRIDKNLCLGGLSLLSSALLLLVLVLGLLSKRLLKDLENLLVGDLLVGLELGKVRSRRSTQTGDTVLGDGCSHG